MTEYWFFVTALLSFVAETLDDVHGYVDRAEGHPMRLISEAIRQNQDNGTDDWTRLLIHSVFLNTIDEMQHMTSATADEETATSDVSTTLVPNGKLRHRSNHAVC